MATVSVASQTVATVLSSASCPAFQSSSSTLRAAALGVPARQNGDLKVLAASSEQHCSRREAMTVAGGAALAGLLLLMPVGSAEARTTNPGVRRKLRKELDELKERAERTTEVIQKNVEGAAKVVTDKVASK